MADIIYYSNRAGKVVVSLDGGETVLLPTGREVPWDAGWVESDEDLRERLTSEQEQRVAKVVAVEQAEDDQREALEEIADDLEAGRWQRSLPCPLCGRTGCARMEKHHLQTRRKDKEDTEWMCSECHKQIHALFSNTELRNEALGLDTVEGLMAHERRAKAVRFIAKQPPSQRVTTRQSNHARRR